ncbi:MAG: urease accessory protein UreG [Gammaproteobacteria bacterium]|nr:MAG: urease accessory protein UreG [Gammaproteobacteria bacterium]
MNKQASQNGPARVGIGGPVGSGKTALIEQLIPFFINRGNEIAIVTNDLVTREDAKRLQQSGLLAPERVVAVEAGACPHTVIREDPTLNIQAANLLDQKFENLDIILIESGGDNLASTFSLDLVDYWMFVIDTSEGDDIPRKRGPGIVQSDLLVINKVDIAKYVGADIDLMVKEGQEVRGDKPLVLTNCKTGQGIEDVANHIINNVLFK